MVRKLLAERSGVAALEFAIVAPLFILMLLAILVFGLFFTVAQSVQQVAAEAARAAVSGLDPAERDAFARASVEAASGRYPLLLADMMTITTGELAEDPDIFQVRIVYDASHLGLAAFSGLLPLPADRIERTALVRRGGW